jgi:hypothetical protein
VLESIDPHHPLLRPPRQRPTPIPTTTLSRPVPRHTNHKRRHLLPIRLLTLHYPRRIRRKHTFPAGDQFWIFRPRCAGRACLGRRCSTNRWVLLSAEALPGSGMGICGSCARRGTLEGPVGLRPSGEAKGGQVVFVTRSVAVVRCVVWHSWAGVVAGYGRRCLQGSGCDIGMCGV